MICALSCLQVLSCQVLYLLRVRVSAWLGWPMLLVRYPADVAVEQTGPAEAEPPWGRVVVLYRLPQTWPGETPLPEIQENSASPELCRCDVKGIGKRAQ